MIVVDTNIIVPLYIEEAQSSVCELLFATDPEWFTPGLWYSEFKHILTRNVRNLTLTESEAFKFLQAATLMLGSYQRPIDHFQSLDASLKYRLSGYDGEYVWLAENLSLPLVTSDKEILKRASHVAIHPEDYLAS